VKVEGIWSAEKIQGTAVENKTFEKVSRSFSRTNSDDGKGRGSFLRYRFRKKIQSCIVF
jgi:hypothetical protein